MSDAITCKQELQIRNEKIVYGYLRAYHDIPKDIMNLCVEYYHVTEEGFIHFNPNNYNVTDDWKVMTKISNDINNTVSTMYGNICIPSWSKTIHKWKFMIHHFSFYMELGCWNRN